ELSHCKTRQCNAKTRPWRLVHLAEYHRCLADNAGIAHLVVQVVTFAGTLAYAGEYRDTAMLLSDVVDQFLDQYSLAYPCAAEQADLTTLGVRSKQVDNFNSSLQNFRLRGQFGECRSLPVNRKHDIAGYFPCV